MKKILIMLAILVGVSVNIEAKKIYYPVYIGSIEIYHSDSLVRNDNIIGLDTLKIPMYQDDCFIQLSTPDVTPFIKESISNRRVANLMAFAGAMNATSAAISASKSIGSNRLNTIYYLSNSYFFLTTAFYDFAIMERFKALSAGSLIIPTKCTIENKSSKILRGNIIIKPNESQELTNSMYCDEWRFTDNENNVYCVRLMAVVIRDEGYMSRKYQIAYVKPTKQEKKEGHKNQYKKIDLNTYKMEWVSKDDKHFSYIKQYYNWDNGYADEPSMNYDINHQEKL